MPVGTPFLGVAKALSSQIGGNAEYSKTLHKFSFGLNFETQKEMSSNPGSQFDLFPKNTFSQFKGEKWMEEVIERINYEKD